MGGRSKICLRCVFLNFFYHWHENHYQTTATVWEIFGNTTASVRIGFPESSRAGIQGKTYYINTPSSDGNQQGLIEIFYNKDIRVWRKDGNNKITNIWRVWAMLKWYLFVIYPKTNLSYLYYHIDHIDYCNLSYQSFLSIGVLSILSKKVGAYNPTFFFFKWKS